MSGWNTPKFEPTKMVIPGGLDFKEKAYFYWRGKCFDFGDDDIDILG